MDYYVHIVSLSFRRTATVFALLAVLGNVSPAAATSFEVDAPTKVAAVNHKSDPMTALAATSSDALCSTVVVNGQVTHDCARKDEIEVKNAIWLFLTAIVGFVFLINKRS